MATFNASTYAATINAKSFDSVLSKLAASSGTIQVKWQKLLEFSLANYAGTTGNNPGNPVYLNKVYVAMKPNQRGAMAAWVQSMSNAVLKEGKFSRKKGETEFHVDPNYTAAGYEWFNVEFVEGKAAPKNRAAKAEPTAQSIADYVKRKGDKLPKEVKREAALLILQGLGLDIDDLV